MIANYENHYNARLNKCFFIERIDENIDHANRVTLVNEIIEAFGQ